MKKLILLITILFTLSNLSAQNLKYEFSVSPSLNFNPNRDFKANSSFGIGLNLGIVLLDKPKYSLLSGISYEYINYRFDQPLDLIGPSNYSNLSRHNLYSQTAIVPLSIRFKKKRNFYVPIGLSVEYNFAAKGKVSNIVYNNTKYKDENVRYNANVNTKLNSSIYTVFNAGLGKAFNINGNRQLFTQLTYFQNIFSDLKIDYKNENFKPFDFNKSGLSLSVGISL